MTRFIRGAAVALALGAALAAPAAEHDGAWVESQVRAVKQSDTTAWKRIPWAGSLLAARRASRAEGVPVFLFTYDGNLETGRC